MSTTVVNGSDFSLDPINKSCLFVFGKSVFSLHITICSSRHQSRDIFYVKVIKTILKGRIYKI